FVGIEEDNVSLAIYPAIAVGHRIQRRVVLIVTAYCRQPQCISIAQVRILTEAIKNDKICLAGRRHPNTFARGRGEMESAGNANARIITLEDWEHDLNCI